MNVDTLLNRYSSGIEKLNDAETVNCVMGVAELKTFLAGLKAAEARYQFEDDHTIDKEKIVIEAEAAYAALRQEVKL